MKLHVSRDGEILGEWTQTELRQLLRASEVRPSDYYWHEGMTDWKRLAELPCGKSVLATEPQQRMLSSMGLPWDEFTTKYDVSYLLNARPCTAKQRSFMDDLGLCHHESTTTEEASDRIDAELSRSAPDGPPTPTQIETIRRLAAKSGVSPTHSQFTSRRDAACEIQALRCVFGS